MTGGRIKRKDLEERLPAILREQFEKDGLPRDHLPSWEYITANTRYSAEGLNNKCQEFYGKTLHEFLQEQGFGLQTSGKWPTEDEETIRSLEYFVKKLRSNNEYSEPTIKTVQSVVNKVYEAIKEEGLDTEMVTLGRYDSVDERLSKIQATVTIIEYMDRHLADGTMKNYPYYFSEYYDIVKNNHRIDFNPVREALDEFAWTRKSENTFALTGEQIRTVWHTIDTLEECPVEGYDLTRWKMWMKILIVFLLAVGPRASEVERFDIQKQLHLGDDPHVEFFERKNLDPIDAPERVPVMFGHDLLRAYRQFVITTGGNGHLVPSEQSSTGSRTADTLNEWIKRVCEIGNVRLPDGSYPTMQHFRRTWKTLYKKAIHKNRDEIKFVSEESGTDTFEVDENNYIDDVENRSHVRSLGREYFDSVLHIEDMPELMKETLDREHYSTLQTNVLNW